MKAKRRLPTLLVYLFSVLATVITMLISERLEGVLGGQHPLFLYMAVITICALNWGFIPGAISAILATVLHNYFAQYPKYTFSINSFSDVLELALFLFVAGLISWVGSSMRSAKKAAEEASQAREEMVAIVSHDLKNPLTAIGISSQLMLRSSLDGEIRVYAQNINRAVNQMNRLIYGILDAEKIRSSNLNVDITSQEPRSIVDEIMPDLQVIARNRSIDLTVNCPANLASVECDRVRMTQVLSNLMGNALKFTPSGGEVNLTVSDTGSDVLFQVQDNGIGMAESEVAHVFERYWQASKASKGGTGLGLYISQKIIQAHGSSIAVKSEKHKGTTFSFPVAKSHSFIFQA